MTPAELTIRLMMLGVFALLTLATAFDLGGPDNFDGPDGFA